MKILQKMVNKALYRKKMIEELKLEELDFMLQLERLRTYRNAQIAKKHLEQSKFIEKIVAEIRYRKALKKYYKAVYDLNSFIQKAYGVKFPLFEYEEP